MASWIRLLLIATCIAASLGSAIAGCGMRAGRRPDLGTQLDCLRQGNLAVVAAHRGQADPSAADNAMSSLRATLAAGVPFLEVDVATTRDGVLVLMHDDTLDRTTTGSGSVASRTWAEIRGVRLKRPDGTLLDEGVPRLADVLDWGRKSGARFELDVKRTTRWEDVIRVVRRARMEEHVLVVTYTLADSKQVHALAPRLMISVMLESLADLEEARRVLPADRMLGWTGVVSPAQGLLTALRDAGIEPILGTLGSAGERLDDVYVADGEASEYADLVRSGVVMIASDRAVVAQRAIGFGYRACLPAR